MTNTCAAPSCEYPTLEGQFVCKICVQTLSRDLGDIPALIDDLHTTLSRQDVLGASSGRRAAETGLPWKEAASEALWVLIDTIMSAVREFHEPGQPFPDAPVLGARWLLTHVQDVASHPDAGRVVDEVASAVLKAYESIDRPPDLLLAGRCGVSRGDGEECPEYLYARPGSTRTACRACETEHEVAERRAWMMEYASDLALPPAMALSWVRLLMGKSIPNGTWRSWVSRGRIEAAGHDHVGAPLYRFGDVRDLAADWVARPSTEAS